MAPRRDRIQLGSLSADEAPTAAHGIVKVFRHAFAQAPYFEDEDGVQRFAYAFGEHVRRDGFRCIVARNPRNMEIVGFAHGYTGGPGQWWREQVVRAMSPDVVKQWLSDYFELVDLAVLPSMQRRGIGGRLHDTLLDGLPYATAMLSTSRAETPASHLYRNRGWVTLVDDFTFSGRTDSFVIMGLDLASWRRKTKPQRHRG